jgi:hypothetical protein
MARWPVLTQILTVVTLGMELFGPIFALATFGLPRLRLAIVLSFIAFHLGLVATMYVGTFSFFCIAGWMLFIPTPIWDRLWRLRPTRFAPIQPMSRTSQIVAGALLAYSLLINFVGFLPMSIRSHLGPLTRLPRFKQSWSVMDRPAPYFHSLVLEIELMDGTTRDVLSTDAPDGAFQRTIPRAHLPEEYWTWPTWLTENVFLVQYRASIMMRTTEQRPLTLEAYVDYHRRKWNESHASPGKQIKSIRAYFAYVQTPSPAGVPARGERVDRTLLYSWPGKS